MTIDFAYHLKFNNSGHKLAMGVKAGGNHTRLDLNNLRELVYQISDVKSKENFPTLKENFISSKVNFFEKSEYKKKVQLSAIKLFKKIDQPLLLGIYG